MAKHVLQGQEKWQVQGLSYIKFSLPEKFKYDGSLHVPYFGKQLNRSDFVGVRKRGRALKLTC